jgi:hypothetical protein
MVLLALIFFIFALGSQLLTLYKHQSANGVSYQAYLIGVIADIFIIMNSYSLDVQIISAIHLVLAFITMVYIIHLQHKTNYKFKEKLAPFIFALSCSFIMITGVSQSIKSYQSKTRKSHVSVRNYFLQSLNLSIMIYLESNIIVILALVISLLLHIYVTIITTISSKMT